MISAAFFFYIHSLPTTTSNHPPPPPNPPDFSPSVQGSVLTHTSLRKTAPLWPHLPKHGKTREGKKKKRKRKAEQIGKFLPKGDLKVSAHPWNSLRTIKTSAAFLSSTLIACLVLFPKGALATKPTFVSPSTEQRCFFSVKALLGTLGLFKKLFFYFLPPLDPNAPATSGYNPSHHLRSFPASPPLIGERT